MSDKAPTPEDEAVSLSGLGLSPWVAERAKVEREKHYAQRRSETDRASDSKVSKWNKGLYSPQGGR
jgi:hypothetical protein